MRTPLKSEQARHVLSWFHVRYSTPFADRGDRMVMLAKAATAYWVAKQACTATSGLTQRAAGTPLAGVDILHNACI